MDPNAGHLASLALKHGIESIRDAGGPLIPFVIVEKAEGRTIQRFMAETLEESLQQACEFVRDRLDEFDRAVIAYDGVVTVNGERKDAILVLAYGKGQPTTHLFAQPYTPKRFLNRVKASGEPLYLGPGDDLKN
jgi:hypothetical protein